MSLVNTFPILHKLSEMSSKHVGEKVVQIHREMICTPLEMYFPKVSLEELHFELLRNGLFDPEEGIEIKDIVKELENQKVGKIVQQEFERLKRLWKGPDVPIIIYPLTKYRPIVDGKEVKKNGVAYQGILFLFLSTEVEEIELKALFAHEYHHICRLAFVNKEPQEILLLDSLIIEGMAECAVEELYGEEEMSPWTKRYSYKEVMNLWQERFVPSLQLPGVINHHSFLYGDESIGLPSWIGYCLGYRIVESYLKNVGPVKQHLLYQIPSDEILKGSRFLV